MADLIGKTVGGYPIEKQLGKGAYGVVYQAQTSGDPLAVKVLREDLAGDKALCEALSRNLEQVRGVVHANLVTCFGTGVDEEHGFFALAELLHVRSLRQLVHTGPKLAWRDMLEILKEIGEGLKALHEAGFAHGDVWASNVLLTQDQDVKLEGSGILAVCPRALSGVLMAPAVGYQAPERIQGAAATPGSDLYALGGCLYFMLAGQDPFSGSDPAAVAQAVLEKEPLAVSEVRDDLTPELQEFLGRLMAKEPTRRYGQTADVLADIDRLRAGQPMEPLRGGPPAQLPERPPSTVHAAKPGAAATAARSPSTRNDPFAFEKPPQPKPPEESSGALAAALLADSTGAAAHARSASKDADPKGSGARLGRGLTSIGKLKPHIQSTIPQSDLERKGDDLYHAGQLAAAVISWKDAFQKGPEHAGLRVKIELGEMELKKQNFDMSVSEAQICLDVGDYENAAKHAQAALDCAISNRQRQDAEKLQELVTSRNREADRVAGLKRTVLLFVGIGVLVVALLVVLLWGRGGNLDGEGGSPPAPPEPAVKTEAKTPQEQNEPAGETVPLPEAGAAPGAIRPDQPVPEGLPGAAPAKKTE
ncbi:MAG: serine/threonine protein kinase [Planctomycetota bacterium]|nr:serine/threonine protein kinase [Planctomycetota bacterium]